MSLLDEVELDNNFLEEGIISKELLFTLSEESSAILLITESLAFVWMEAFDLKVANCVELRTALTQVALELELYESIIVLSNRVQLRTLIIRRHVSHLLYQPLLLLGHSFCLSF